MLWFSINSWKSTMTLLTRVQIVSSVIGGFRIWPSRIDGGSNLEKHKRKEQNSLNFDCELKCLLGWTSCPPFSILLQTMGTAKRISFRQLFDHLLIPAEHPPTPTPPHNHPHPRHWKGRMTWPSLDRMLVQWFKSVAFVITLYGSAKQANRVIYNLLVANKMILFAENGMKIRRRKLEESV